MAVLPDWFSCFAGEAPGDIFHLVAGVPGERVRSGCSPVLRPPAAAHLPPGLVLRGHRDGHQPEGSHAGVCDPRTSRTGVLSTPASHSGPL